MKLSFNPQKGLIIIPTRLWGPQRDSVIRLALDTGATGSMINWDILVLLGYDPAAVQNRIQMTTGSGVEFVPVVSCSRIQALGAIPYHPARPSMEFWAWISCEKRKLSSISVKENFRSNSFLSLLMALPKEPKSMAEIHAIRRHGLKLRRPGQAA